ncbi:hypothetical protein BDZ89DRAFT_1067055 [Hymenopellis radicata]|nr:hypothetical protein BDZ89DRAFT_1067055 [Hymenopellis radicata]
MDTSPGPSGASPSGIPQHPIPAPFDVSDEADLVIQTSDNAHLFVLKALLVYNSEFFRNVLADSLPSESYQNLPLLPVAESSRTMITVMQLCYPNHISPAEMVDIIAAVPLMQTLRKYIMEKAERRLLDVVQAADTDLLKKYPLRWFAIARSYGWDNLARKVAKLTLRIPLSEWERAEELRLINALDYHSLVDYFKRSGQAVPRVVTPALEIGPIYSPPTDGYQRCPNCKETLRQMNTGTPTVWGHAWVQDYLNQSQTMIGQWRSVGCLDQGLQDVIFEKAVKSCGSQTAGVVRRMLELLENAIDREISKVEIVLD